MVLLLATTALSFLSANHTPLPRDGAKSEQHSANSQIAEAADKLTFAIKNAVESVQEDRGCNEDKEDRKSELCAQWKATDAAEDSAIWAMRSFWMGLCGTVLLLISLRSAVRGTNAAVGALDAQIAADRPLMNLSSVDFSLNNKTNSTILVLNAGWSITNYGRSAGWIEQVCANVSSNSESSLINNCHIINAFLAPDRSISSDSDVTYCTFNEIESEEVRFNKSICLFGYVVYRESSGRRWKTGFAAQISLTDDFNSRKEYSPLASDEHWIDERVTTKQALRFPILKIFRIWKRP